MAEESDSGRPFEMMDLFTPVSDLISHLLLEEFIMLVLTVLPLGMGIIAALHVMTGVTKGPLDAGDSGDLGELGEAVHRDVENSTHTLQGNMSKVESQIVDLQRSHDQRFADLHKDLAGIVWELSKLRADMARWQALAQLGGRGGRGGARGPSTSSLPDPTSTSDDSARAAGAAARDLV